MILIAALANRPAALAPASAPVPSRSPSEKPAEFLGRISLSTPEAMGNLIGRPVE